ncbi:MAG: hypothetical protein ACODAE_03215 [Gemmatimonadota bacterium]
MTTRIGAADSRSDRSPVELTGRGKTRDRAIARLALVLERPSSAVERNVPGALQDVLCRLPWERALRRHRDRVVLQDVRFLWEQMESDDLRRPRLKFMLEHAERRSRL